MKDAAFAEFSAHFPTAINEAMEQYVIDVALAHSRYLFTWRVGAVQMAYCVHCHKEYPHGVGQAAVKHNDKTQCLNCGSDVIAKASGLGRKNLEDDAYFVWYEKSLINPKAIVARGLYAWRNYSGDFRQVKTQYSTVAMYLFEPVDARRKANCQMYRKGYSDKFSPTSSIHSEFKRSMLYKEPYCSYESIEQAVKGTPFEYSTWKAYTNQSWDLVTFFDLAAKYPCIEYLTKLGLHRFVDAKLTGHNTFGAINWRGKSIEKVLRMTKAEVKELRSVKFPLEPISIYSYQVYKRRGMGFNFMQAHQLRDLADGHYSRDTMKLLMSYASERTILKYILRQVNKQHGHYRMGNDVVIAWRDYIRDCKDLGMDLEQEHVLFPNDLYVAHQKTIEKVKIKADAELNVKIAKRLPELMQYRFEKDGLMIRPAESSIELFQEGRDLNHCVGRYSETYAAGKTNIFLIRRVDKPDVPFYTVEVINNKITQARGLKNCNPTDEVSAFLKAFEIERLRKIAKRTPKRVQMTA